LAYNSAYVVDNTIVVYASPKDWTKGRMCSFF
jgi:hypothetical protein